MSSRGGCAGFLTSERRRLARQPGLGIAGLLLVLPVAALIAFGAGSAESSLLILAPLATFALPPLAMIAFWWEDWPGSSLRPGWSGLLDTLLIVVAAVRADGGEARLSPPPARLSADVAAATSMSERAAARPA